MFRATEASNLVKKSALMKSLNKIYDKKFEDIANEDTSDNLVELVHHIEGCEDITESDISEWISSDTECDLTNHEIIHLSLIHI